MHTRNLMSHIKQFYICNEQVKPFVLTHPLGVSMGKFFYVIIAYRGRPYLNNRYSVLRPEGKHEVNKNV